MLLKAVKNSILSIGKSITDPIFIKDFDKKNLTISELEKLKATTNDEDVLERINRDIMYLKAGLVGEKNVYYELKNSFLPIVCFHDLYIQHEDYEAQIDFLIITNKFICILETKKLSGDIVVNDSGDFIRQIKNSKGKIIKKEGIYSPITQNERHVRIVKDLLIKNNIIKNCPVISMVVMANPKSIVNTRYAPQNVKRQLIKYDQISRKLRSLLNGKKDVDMSYQTIMDIAEFLKDRHIDKKNHYILSKYDDLVIKEENTSYDTVKAQNYDKLKDDNEQIITELKEFRLKRSQQEKIKPYYIFNNKQMEDLIEKMPKTKEELLKVSGFGPVKTEKYGDEIINIILRYEN